MLDVKPLIQAGVDIADVRGRITEVKHPAAPDVAVPVTLDTQGSTVALAKDILDALDARRPGPTRRTGTTTLTEVASFVAYLQRWGSPSAVVYADTAQLRLTAVLDDHPAGAVDTAWRQHRAAYTCPRAAEWIAWLKQAEQTMSQTEFGDWIEARLEDLVKGTTPDPSDPKGERRIEIKGSPEPTEMLSIARFLNIKTEGTFRRKINPTNGDYEFAAETKTSNDSTQIPRAFWIAIPCFEGGERYQVEVRLRFTLKDGVPLFAFTLHRAKEIERDAFDEVRVKVGTETGMLVLAGTP